jgi:hypothetical protein
VLSAQYIHNKQSYYEKWSLNIPRVSLIIRLVGNIKRLKIIRFDLSLSETEGGYFYPLDISGLKFFCLWSFNPNVPIFLKLTKIGLMRLVNIALTLNATMVILFFFFKAHTKDPLEYCTYCITSFRKKLKPISNRGPIQISNHKTTGTVKMWG